MCLSCHLKYYWCHLVDLFCCIESTFQHLAETLIQSRIKLLFLSPDTSEELRALLKGQLGGEV